MGFFDPADEKQKNVLNKYSHKSKGFLFEKTLRYTERYLEAGDEIYVLGEVVGRENSKPVFRKAQFPLFVSDKSENELLRYYSRRIIFSTVVILLIVLIGYFMYADQLIY